MNVDDVKTSSKEEQQAAILLYRKVKRAVCKGKDATVKQKKNGELCVYEVDIKIAE